MAHTVVENHYFIIMSNLGYNPLQIYLRVSPTEVSRHASIVILVSRFFMNELNTVGWPNVSFPTF